MVMAASENLMQMVPPVRLVDDGGVEEESFLDSVEKAWNVACRVATTVGEVASTISAIGAALL